MLGGVDSPLQLRDMQLEVRVAPKGTQQETLNRLAQHRAEIAHLRHQLVSGLACMVSTLYFISLF